jgi:photosystem II stability/assembly factor-like uncharacterized protein
MFMFNQNFPIKMKTIIALLSFISLIAMTPNAFGQPQKKTVQPKEVVAADRSKWVPSSISRRRNDSVRVALPSARTTVIPQKQNIITPAGENTVFKSTDSGQTWQDVSDGLPNKLIGDGLFSTSSGLHLRSGDGIYRSNANFTGPFWIKEICPSQYSGVAPAKRGIIAYNYDGQFVQKISSAWVPIFPNFKEQLVRTVFETSAGVFFIGSDKGLFKSTNNGITWKQVHTAGWAMKLVEANGVLMATSQQGILRSIDNGENWEVVIDEGGVGIAVESINGGFAAITYNTQSETRRVRVSYDNGKNWQPIDAGLPEDASIASIVQLGGDLFCGHPAGIFRSSDMGKTWKLLLPSVGSKVFNLFVSGNVIYAIARNGGC